MKCDISGIKKSAKILRNAKVRLDESLNLIDNAITKLSKVPKKISPEDEEAYKEKCKYIKTELRKMKKRINTDYITSAKTIRKWVVNKANKLEQSEELSKNVLLAEEVKAVPINEELFDMNILLEQKIDNVYNEMINISKKEKYFTQKELKNSMNKIVTCSNDEEFEKIYKKSGQNGNANNLESFRYKGKIYLRPNASEHTIEYEINRDIAATKRAVNLSNNTSKSTVPTKGINKSLAEFVTRLDSNTDNKVSNNYDASVEFLEFLQNSLNNLGCVDLITKTGYGTKQELKAKLKEITGDNEFYNSMLNSMYTITEDSKATKKEINAAKNQLKKLTNVFQEKCGLYANGTTKDSDIDIDKNMNLDVNTDLNMNENADNVKEEKNKDGGTVTKRIDGQDVVLPEGDKVYFLDTGWLYKDKESGENIQRGSDSFILESKDENGNPIYGLIDTGMASTSNRTIEYLKELGVEKLDFVLITHAHGDHAGGYENISKEFQIDKVYMKQEVDANKYMKNIRNIAKENNTEICWVNNKDNKKIKKNQKIQLGTYEIQLFNTTDQIQGKKVKNKDGQEVAINDNVNTITALATSNGKSVYFAGDIGNYSGINAGTEAAEQASKALNGQPVDVYKVAHHSRGGHNNSEKEIDLLKPKSSVATMAKKRIDSGDKDFKAADDRIREYTNGKSYYTTAGTVVMNIGTYGDLTLKQMPNYWTSAGKKVGKDTKKTTKA